ncbi:cobalt-precorrin-6A reductase [Devosia nitrariae]|uniref:Precorrin-6A reductase n=1 Tax=Devosia nitrariae TaxID=2071872 RepID=A0ABQ5VZ98_9HYPH|nr:cobalt-precorrin-6A reductase [Devosia nitrariae]GLQ52965.1 precorrin-6A reductase [Devosia nitrariae]
MRILILGGTGEARELADRLVGMGHEVVTSLAGRTQDPKLPQGNVRIGGFGGIAGLEAYLRAAHVEAIVDATHPYAGTISAHASLAARSSGVPLVRLLRPAWKPPAGARWTIVATLAEAASSLPHQARVLLTTGHAGLELFLERDDCTFLVRLIEPPQHPLPPHARLLLARPPHALEDELALLRQERITHLVSKNSGGEQTAAKLEAARQLNIVVIMIERPVYGPAVEVANVKEALATLEIG